MRGAVVLEGRLVVFFLVESASRDETDPGAGRLAFVISNFYRSNACHHDYLRRYLAQRTVGIDPWIRESDVAWTESIRKH